MPGDVRSRWIWATREPPVFRWTWCSNDSIARSGSVCGSSRETPTRSWKNCCGSSIRKSDPHRFVWERLVRRVRLVGHAEWTTDRSEVETEPRADLLRQITQHRSGKIRLTGDPLLHRRRFAFRPRPQHLVHGVVARSFLLNRG